ncbi:MAG: hypothetical protein OEO19_06555 [Gammaproteobacteria bacterium]|nr:hypothetical protein [Gammaproteobacteria bacterium]
MRATYRLALVLALSLSSQTAAAIDKTTREAFDRLLLESGLRIETRQSYTDIPIRANPVLPYEHAMKHESGALELRFIVRPLNRIAIEYNDPHNAAPEPNHLFPLLFESITNRLSAGSDTSSSTFSEAEAKKSFNANWAAAAAFDVRPEFAADYRNGLLIGMHRNEMADAYTLFLYNDHERAKPLISEAISIMSFNPETE